MEGGVYVLDHYLVGVLSENFRTTMNRYKINFQYKAIVHQCEDPKISLTCYSFMSFEDIVSNAREKEYRSLFNWYIQWALYVYYCYANHL